MKQEFKGQQVSFTIADDQTGFDFTLHGLAPESHRENVMFTSDAIFLGRQFAYSVLGVNNASENGAEVNEDGSITAHFLVR